MTSVQFVRGTFNPSCCPVGWMRVGGRQRQRSQPQCTNSGLHKTTGLEIKYTIISDLAALTSRFKQEQHYLFRQPSKHAFSINKPRLTTSWFRSVLNHVHSVLPPHTCSSFNAKKHCASKTTACPNIKGLQQTKQSSILHVDYNRTSKPTEFHTQDPCLGPSSISSPENSHMLFMGCNVWDPRVIHSPSIVYQSRTGKPKLNSKKCQRC